MVWALAIVHICSGRGNSSDRSRFDRRRSKAHDNGTPRSTAHYLKTYLKREGSLRLAGPVAVGFRVRFKILYRVIKPLIQHCLLRKMVHLNIIYLIATRNYEFFTTGIVL